MIRTNQQKAQEFYKRLNDEVKINDNRKFKNLNKEFYDGIEHGIKFAKMHYKFTHGIQEENK
ncbi:hypothetical protein [Desemzia sp. FAM 23989]|uniref:hypothetical protein n=1 Tax=Desemzia sp. FAM 23989 TaxID=3259523 RepID=UPI0038873CFE